MDPKHISVIEPSQKKKFGVQNKIIKEQHTSENKQKVEEKGKENGDESE